MEPGWFVLFVFMIIEAFFVLLLVMPMPSNKVRGAITGFVTLVWDQTPAVRYTAILLTLVNLVYFVSVFDALAHPLYQHLGFMTLSEDLLAVSCELRASHFERERNAYICGFSLFLFLVLRRLVDIQAKLHESRADVKTIGHGVPMGMPIGSSVPPRSKFD